MKGVKGDCQVFGLNNWRERVATYREEEAGVGFGDGPSGVWFWTW